MSENVRPTKRALTDLGRSFPPLDVELHRVDDALIQKAQALPAEVAIEGAERAARREKTSPPPFYAEQAAIVHRKLGQRDEEIAVLRRYVAACPPQHRETSLKARLEKLLG